MKRVSFLLVIALCFFMAGCGPKTGGSYAVSGRITEVADPDKGIEGVTLAFGGSHGTATTDANGNWSKSGLTGVVTVTPAKEGWAFDPINRQVTTAAGNVNFSGSAYIVYGRITRQDNGQGLGGVALNFSGGFSSVYTAPDGTWNKIGLKGAITVTPSKDGWAFDPSSRQVIGLANDVDFVACPYTVSGRVTRQDNGQGLEGVTLSLSGGYGSVVTGADGTWRKSGLNGTITVTPTKEGWAFNPWNTVVVTTTTNVDFAALSANPITFDDPYLERQVRQKIGKPTGPLMDIDVMGITSLAISETGISRLGGIQHLVNLEELHLGGNHISDISPLAGLTKLVILGVDRNQVSDISPLAGLTKLVMLGVEANQIAAISALAGLTELGFLYMGANQIADISPLAGLANIEELQLSYNSISDLSPLARLTNMRTLRLDNNKIEDISALVANPGLSSGDKIDLKGNRLDLSPGSDDMQNINTLIGRGVRVYY